MTTTMERQETSNIAQLEQVEDHDLYRILLYYCYIPIPDVAALVDFHDSFQQEDEASAENAPTHEQRRRRYGGRIRVASEGLNGVLSGTYADLLFYEGELREQLAKIAPGGGGASSLTPGWELDMKYCQLRPDLTVEEQLFEQLQVQKTSQVVALVDMNNFVADSPEKDENTTFKKSGYAGNRRQRRKNEQKQLKNNQIVNADQHRLAQEIFHRSLTEHSSSEIYVPHLSPAEWDARLRELTSNGESNVVLLDCRNSYESAVGYFQAQGASTLLTNTRKYSELPFVLMDQSDKSLADASAIFMYCTGGVRCERASGFLRTLLEDKQKNSQGEFCQHQRKTAPEIYQLHGGIQRYIEDSSTGGLFRGKNFVFDPRRTDPLTNSTETVVGQCLVCAQPHDDYDNGHAPASNQEARCCKCRILVLVCNACRTKVTCWGDDMVDSKPKLFCGGLETENECLHMPPVREIKS